MSNQIILKLTLVSVALVLTATGCLYYLRGEIVAGTAFYEGRPIMGQIQVVNPKTMKPVKTDPVNNQGHFIISDIWPGEYFLSFIGPATAPLGEFMYIKVEMGRSITGLTFEITEKDPKVTELLDKIKSEESASSTAEKKD